MSSNDERFELNCFRRFFVIHELNKELGINKIKFVILQAIPYPFDASNPNALMNAHKAIKDKLTITSWKAIGPPTLIIFLISLLNLMSFNLSSNGNSCLDKIINEQITLTA